MRLTEQQLTNIIKETIKESLFGLSFDNFARNGHFHEESRSQNPVIQLAWRNGWELSKVDEQSIEGQYDAKMMSGAFNNVEADENPESMRHPKLKWETLIAVLNKELRPQGYMVVGTVHSYGNEGLMPGRYSNVTNNRNELSRDNGAIAEFGKIIVKKIEK